jgi:hypothetical protein
VRHPFLRTLAGSGVTTDPNFENVTLLLHGDGTNGGQNNTFVDGSTNNFTITRNGNTTQGTFSPYGDNWSNFFDGTDDYLSIADNANLRAGAGAFTIEAWIYRNATGAAHTIYAKGGASTGIVLQVTSTNVLRFTHTTTNIDSTGTIGLATWTHVAVVREGTGTNETKLYINGTQDGAGTVSTDFTQTEEVRIGTDRSAAADFNGYISNLRFVKGTAVYTGAFTVPTSPLTAISNTQLLTCKSNRFRDESANAFTVIRNNNASVQRFSPFSPTAAYAAGTIGGSGYFDGSGDYLGVPSGAFSYASGTAYTFEVWVYPTSFPTQYPQVFGPAVTSGSNTASMYIENNGSVGFGQANVGTFYTAAAGTVRLNCWNHIAIGKNSSNSGRMWVNGVSVATATDTANYATGATIVGQNPAATQRFAGYICDLRSVAGSDVYGSANTTITVPTAPLSSVTNTQLRLAFQNAAILDNAMMSDLETVGNAQIDTTTKKYGTGSMKFDGTGDYLTVPNNPAFSFGTGDFTIECWVYIAGNSSPDGGGNRTAGLFSAYAASGVVSRGYTFEIEGNASTTGTGLSFYNNNSGTQISLIATTTISQGTWHHVAVCRSGTTTRLFLNGSSVASGTLSNQNVNSDYPITIGRLGYASFLQEFNGYIDDLRITKGVARYTSNFTAPTSAFPDL